MAQFTVTRICLSLLSGLVVQVAIVSVMNSPNCDEIGHLGAGVYTLDLGKFDVYRVNPPLVRSLAAVPVVLCNPHRDYRAYAESPSARVEWRVGHDFIVANPGGWEWYFIFARWALLPLIVLGGLVVYRWSSELNGPQGGLISLALYCFCPNMIAWSATINPDAVVAALGVLAAYSFWKWLRIPTWRSAVVAGLCLGLAELSKFSWIVLLPLLPVLWLMWRWVVTRGLTNDTDQALSGQHSAVPPSIKQLAAILLLAVYMVNLGYGFEGSFTPLREYMFVSQALAGEETNGNLGASGNRFRDSWVGLLPVPVPYHYLSGIDQQKVDFERGAETYLNGRWSDHGYWYYYLYATLLKVPLGTWLLALILIVEWLFATWLWWAERNRHTDSFLNTATNISSITLRDRIVLLGPAVALLILVSSQTGLNRYFRYVLPCLPFFYVWLGQLSCGFQWQERSLNVGNKRSIWSRCRSWLIGGALAWSISSSLAVFPHSLSYFNELTGGPMGGHYYLIDANIDWGQDAYYFRRWLKQHPEVTKIHTLLQCSIPSLKSVREDGVIPDEPIPGWYAISVHRIHHRSNRYLYFLRLKPTAIAGYSIYIYHITPETANEASLGTDLPVSTMH